MSLATVPRIYPQGSFRLGTVTKPLSDAEEYDLDLVSELNLQKNPNQPGIHSKDLVGEEIKSYVHATQYEFTDRKKSRRCWTLKLRG